MRISDSYFSGVQTGRRPEFDPATGTTPSDRPVTLTAGDSSEFAGASELAQLSAAVMNTDEIRTGLVESVSRRLAAGFYDTHDAAQQTADAILNAAE